MPGAVVVAIAAALLGTQIYSSSSAMDLSSTSCRILFPDWYLRIVLIVTLFLFAIAGSKLHLSFWRSSD